MNYKTVSENSYGDVYFTYNACGKCKLLNDSEHDYLTFFHFHSFIYFLWYWFLNTPLPPMTWFFIECNCSWSDPSLPPEFSQMLKGYPSSTNVFRNTYLHRYDQQSIGLLTYVSMVHSDIQVVRWNFTASPIYLLYWIFWRMSNCIWYAIALESWLFQWK